MTDTLSLLRTRRSVSPLAMTGPAPTQAELDTMLAAAARVPDHGKLAPWRFVVIEGEARNRLGEVAAAIFRAENPDADADRLAIERGRSRGLRWSSPWSAGRGLTSRYRSGSRSFRRARPA